MTPRGKGRASGGAGRRRRASPRPGEIERLRERLRCHEEALRESEERLLADRREAERRLFEANQRLQALMDALPVGVSFSSDRSCRDVTGNAAALAQLDAEPGDNLSARAPNGNAPGGRARFFQHGRPLGDSELPLHRAVAENRSIPPVELEVVMPSGRRWYADASGAPIRDVDGNAVGGVSVTVDITSRKEAEEGLRLARLELERKIREGTAALAERATPLRALAAELTLSEQRERRRMAKILHDHLQQLLTGAKSRAAFLGCRADPSVRHAVVELEELLDSALDTSRALTVELSPPILHDGQLVDGLEWLRRWMAERHGLVVVLSEVPGVPPLAEDVKVLLFESVRELLFNTVKHARVRSAIVNLRPFRGDFVQVIVTDSGRGFDPAKVERAGDAGFGLFSIRERLGLVGGTMEIHSVPGRGTRVTLTVPAREAAPRAAPAAGPPGPEEARPAPPAPPKRERVRVLLADDHAVVREGLRLLLELQPGIEIVGEARDGHVAVEMAGRLQPDVVLMDIGMPNLDGVEATRAIRATHPAVRVIGLSMFQDDERIQAILEAGAMRYLSKSGPPAELIAAVLACVDDPPDEAARPPAAPRVGEAEGAPRRS